MASFKFPKTNPDSLRAMAYAIRNELSGGDATDDSSLSIRLIEYKIKLAVNLIQKQEDKANELLGIPPSDTRRQIIACIPLEETNDFYCSCTKRGGKFKKAIVPTWYEWRGQPYINYVGDTEMSREFVPMTSINALNAYAADIPYPSYFMAGNALYVSLPAKYILMCTLSIIGIPEDSTATNGLCFDPWSASWAVPSYIKALAQERVLQSFAQVLLPTSQQPDERNNANRGNAFVTSQTP